MSRSIDYYFSCISPWSYLGHAPFIAIAKKHTLTVAYRPMPSEGSFPRRAAWPLPSAIRRGRIIA